MAVMLYPDGSACQGFNPESQDFGRAGRAALTKAAPFAPHRDESERDAIESHRHPRAATLCGNPE
jgi:hypothetical protein